MRMFKSRLGALLLCGCMILQGMPMQAKAAEPEDIQSTDFGEVIWAEAAVDLYQEGALWVETLSGAGEQYIYATDAGDESGGIQQYLYRQLVDRVESIDVSGYGIAVSDMSALWSSVINEHPELYYVGGMTCSYYLSTGCVTTVKVTYQSGFDDAAFARATRRALSGIDDEAVAAAYNHKVQKKVPAVRWGTKKLSGKKDFLVSYPDETAEGAYREPGEYRILVTGKGNYCGQIEVPMTVVKTDAKDETAPRLMSKAKVSAVPAQEYTGEAVRLETQGLPVVKYGKERLVEGEDYELIYGEDCTQIGTYPLIVRGIGQYVGEIHTTFKIKGISINTVKVTGIVNRVYDGAAKTQELTVTDKEGSPLAEGVDFAVEYANNVEAGTAQIAITGMGKYSGTLKKTFRITALSLEDVPAERLEIGFARGTAQTQLYEKGGAKPKLVICYHYTDEQGDMQSITLQEGVHYSLSYKNNTTASPKEGKEPYILVKGRKNFAKSVRVDFGITRADLSGVTMTAADVQENARPGKYYSTPVLTDANGKKLVKGTDYETTFLYTNQSGEILDRGARPTAGDVITVTVTGRGNYTGTNRTTYRIYEKGKSVASAKVKVLRPIYYTGEPVTLAESDLEVKIGKTVLDADDYKIVSYSYVNNLKKGTARLTITGRGEYAGTKTVSFKIQPQNLKWWEKVKQVLIGNR